MFAHSIQWLCRSAQKYLYICLALIFVSCGVAAFFLVELQLDTNIVRLLPEKSRVSQWTRELKGPLGDGGYFTILIESNDREALLAAANHIYKKASNLSEVAFVSHRNPIEFIEKYKYSLLSVPVLERLCDYVLRLEAEASLFGADLMAEEPISITEENQRNSLQDSLEILSSFSEYNQNANGTLMGMVIYPKSMITELEAIRKLHNRLEEITGNAAAQYSVLCQIGGSQIKNLREYKSIFEDLGRAGTISLVAIVAVIIFSFRSLLIIPIVLLPLLVGLAWAFAFVPAFVGPLNIITIFLLLILFGIGIDYSIHLIRHYQLGLQTKPSIEALRETYSVTGKSVILSGLTTALPLFILSFSDFRGFADFGLIGGWSILMMLAAMFIVLPPLLIIADKYRLISAGVTLSGSISPPPKVIAVPAILFIVIAFIITISSGELFDYNFSAHSDDHQDVKDFDLRHKQVYKRSMVPAALYLAPDLHTLDRSRAILDSALEKDGSTILRLTSVRDFAPDEREFEQRQMLIRQAKEILEGNWYKNISDRDILKWVDDFRRWQPPAAPPVIDTLPEEIRSYYMARDGSGQFLLGIYPSVSRRNGHEVLAFHQELNQIILPDNLQGPVGEVVIFAEILKLVLDEAPLIIFLAVISVALPILVISRSLKETAYSLFPLVFGMLLLIAIMGASGMKLNYLSIVIIPALLGMGVDDGIHYFRHCKAHGYDVRTTQKELFGTLSVCTLTTMIGYFGLIIAHNRGLRSLGVVACLGMLALWFTSVFLLPAFLQKWHGRPKEIISSDQIQMKCNRP